MPNPDKIGQNLLNLGNFRAHDESSMIHHTLDTIVNGLLVSSVLGLDINELHMHADRRAQQSCEDPKIIHIPCEYQANSQWGSVPTIDTPCFNSWD